MEMTDIEVYRMFLSGEWDLSFSNPQARLEKILEKAQADPELARQIAEIHAQFEPTIAEGTIE